MQGEIFQPATEGEDLLVQMHERMPRNGGAFGMIEEQGYRECFRAGKPDVHRQALGLCECLPMLGTRWQIELQRGPQTRKGEQEVPPRTADLCE